MSLDKETSQEEGFILAQLQSPWSLVQNIRVVKPIVQELLHLTVDRKQKKRHEWLGGWGGLGITFKVTSPVTYFL
jgi:hypothetical protein